MKISPAAIYGWYRQTLRHPTHRWWLIIGTIVYLISPLDLSTDFIPFLGQIDDIMLISLLVTELSSIALQSYRERTESNLNKDEGAKDETIDVKATPVD